MNAGCDSGRRLNDVSIFLPALSASFRKELDPMRRRNKDSVLPEIHSWSPS